MSKVDKEEVIYLDKNGKQIKENMFLKHGDGTIEKVYLANEGELGFNASNESWSGFSELNREIYPLYQFPLKEYVIVDGEELKQLTATPIEKVLTDDEKIFVNTKIVEEKIKMIYEDFDLLSGAMHELSELLDDEKNATFFHEWNSFPTYNNLDGLLGIMEEIRNDLKSKK